MTRDNWSEEYILKTRISRIMCQDSITDWGDEVKSLGNTTSNEKEYYLAADLKWAVGFAKKIVELAQVDPTCLPMDAQLYTMYSEIKRQELDEEIS